MRYNQLKQDLIAYGKQIGIDKIGFTTGDPFLLLKERLIAQQEKGYASGFEHDDIDERVFPELNMDNVQSIISIAVAYPTKLSYTPKSAPGARRGMFSRSSWGKDYHVALKERAQKLVDFLHERVPEAAALTMVDTGALADRAVAERAGVGFSAKNTFIITDEFGSFVFLGNILTSIPFEPDEPLENLCGDCTRCLDACPTGALVEPGVLNAQACLSFQTQTKGFMPDEYREKIGNFLYGWDTCQVVCPYNKSINHDHHEDMSPEPETVKPLLLPILTMSNKEFKQKFGHLAGAWRGKKPIQRNAILALAHFKETSALPILKTLLTEDPRPVIRGTAAWAIGKMGQSIKEEKTLLAAKLQEKDDEVIAEINKGMTMLRDKFL